MPGSLCFLPSAGLKQEVTEETEINSDRSSGAAPSQSKRLSAGLALASRSVSEPLREGATTDGHEWTRTSVTWCSRGRPPRTMRFPSRSEAVRKSGDFTEEFSHGADECGVGVTEGNRSEETRFSGMAARTVSGTWLSLSNAVAAEAWTHGEKRPRSCRNRGRRWRTCLFLPQMKFRLGYCAESFAVSSTTTKRVVPREKRRSRVFLPSALALSSTASRAEVTG